MPGGVGDRDTWRRAIGMYRQAFPDSHVTYEDLIVCGDAREARRRLDTDIRPLLSSGRPHERTASPIFWCASEARPRPRPARCGERTITHE